MSDDPAPIEGLGISYMIDEDTAPMDIHEWFGLSYASYLTINRSLLQSMPDQWQHEFVKLLMQLWEHFPNVHEPRYFVQCRDDQGHFITDPIPNYNRGRTIIRPEDAYGSNGLAGLPADPA